VATRAILLCCLYLLALLAPAARASVANEDGNAASPVNSGQGVDLYLATVESDDNVRLADILSGQARVGFNPLLRGGVGLVANPERTLWLRVRGDLPTDGRALFLSLPRQSIDRVRAYSEATPDRVLGETGIGHAPGDAAWPDALVLPMQAETAGTSTAYFAIKGRGRLILQPALLGEAQVRQQAAEARRAYQWLYGSLLLIGLLAVVRRWMSGEPGYRLAQAAFACLAAAMVDANHLQFAIGGSPLSARPNLPMALWLLACALLLRATTQYAGHEKNSPEIATLLDRGALGLIVLAIAALFVPPAFLHHLQVVVLYVLALTALGCGASLLLDQRHWRWTPIIAWLGVVVALLAFPLSYWQLMPASVLARRGFQLMLALLLGCYLVLPWLRQALRERARLRRAAVVEPSTEEKIAHAREWLMTSLQTSMESAGEADMKWIAYRRLMAGLKPVLPQTAAAVIAMNYHNEDLLLVEPRPAEERFRMLLGQRASLLKSLSRSLAPQQIVLDFDGPEGPLPHVMLAIIPLPIDRPGWGALVIEREKDANYSDAELDLCAEFAALATTAADEAAEVMQQRVAVQLDPDTGTYRADMTEKLLKDGVEVAVQKRKPLSVLRVSIDAFGDLAPDAAPALARSVADTIRDEIDFGETIARCMPEEFLVLLSGRSAGEAKALAERICTEVRRHPLPAAHGSLTVSVGVAQMQPGERAPAPMLERSVKALGKAREYGGNQAQMVAGLGP
jgi:diguanylate cyclase (GGDEF)-like protein